MRRFLGGLLALLLITACRDAPKDVIAKRKMVNVLTDLHLIEGYLMSMPQDSMQLVAKQYYQAIYDKYGTDSAGLYNSIAYYSNDPTELDKIYEKVQSRLTDMEQQEQSKMDAKIRKQFVADSIRSAYIADSVRRVALDSVRLKWSNKLVFIDSTDLAVADTLTGRSDSLPPIAARERWLHQQDRMLHYLGVGKLIMPVSYDSAKGGVVPSNPSVSINNGSDKKVLPKDVPTPVMLDGKPAASSLGPNKPVAKREQMKEQE
ncbi:DUF4296 domain-containing protein [Olivibacter sitiensis]|uniref:DUF4296 domain-containing protein n=1 Tax=Olivibacter sitiensis TaxID=376470 RepID=UPI00068723F8|nr:DUF4296 domain-containing protein [Olivibacter sitiensis]